MLGLILFLSALILVGVLAAFAGVDSTDSRSESARPDQGWHPLLSNNR